MELALRQLGASQSPLPGLASAHLLARPLTCRVRDSPAQGFRKEFGDQDAHFDALQKAFRFRTETAAVPSAAAAVARHASGSEADPLAPPEEMESHVWERVLEYREAKLAAEAVVAAAQAEAAELAHELAVLVRGTGLQYRQHNWLGISSRVVQRVLTIQQRFQ